MNFDSASSSTVLYNTVEVYREVFGKIWQQHEALNDCFGLSILAITLKAFAGIALPLYINILTHSDNISNDSITHPTLHTFHITFMFFIMIYTCERSDAVVDYATHFSLTFNEK